MPRFAHGCNTLGAMGAGVAKQVRAFAPGVYDAYYLCCVHILDQSKLLGLVHFGRENGVTIFNCFTQDTIGQGGDAKMWALQQCLNSIRETHDFGGDIYFPRIGCGLGGLTWEGQVQVALEKFAEQSPHLNVHIVDMVTA